MTLTPTILEFYVQPACMTSAGKHVPLLDPLPADVAGLVRVVQGLYLHQHWASTYGEELSDDRKSGSQLRAVEQRFDRLLTDDRRPLSTARPVASRLVGVCSHYSVLLAALLRSKGIPARARCGFGTYFIPGHFEDHWVAEYWDAGRSRWVFVDAQIDELQRAKLPVDFDLLDVPRDRFLVAGEAWARCRVGDADPAAFGIFDMKGLWFVAGNLFRDFAALNNMEMLPWDCWGDMPRSTDPMPDVLLQLLDRVAALTRDPDASFAELRALYESDDRLRVPATVFNAVLGRLEAV